MVKWIKVAKCPYCNVTLEEDDCIDMEDEGSRIVKRLVGSCPDCWREFQWIEIFTYDGAGPPMEIM